MPVDTDQVWRCCPLTITDMLWLDLSILTRTSARASPGDASIDIATAAVAAAQIIASPPGCPSDQYAQSAIGCITTSPLTLCCRAPRQGPAIMRRSGDRRASLRSHDHRSFQPARRSLHHALLRDQGGAVIDVRSVPFSRWCPWFSSKPLATRLAAGGVAYLNSAMNSAAARAIPNSTATASPTTRPWRGGPNCAGLDRVIDETRRHRCASCARARAARLPPLSAGRPRLAERG